MYVIIMREPARNQIVETITILLLGGMAFSLLWGHVLSIFFFPILVGQISAGIGYNPGACGIAEKTTSNEPQNQKKSCQNTWVSIC